MTMKYRDVRLYVGLCRGPGDPRGLISMATSFVRGPYARPRRWRSSYASKPADITLRHWRWGPLKCGFRLVEVIPED